MRQGKYRVRGENRIQGDHLRGTGLDGMRQGDQPSQDCSHGDENAKPETDSDPARGNGRFFLGRRGAFDFDNVIHCLTLFGVSYQLTLHIVKARGIDLPFGCDQAEHRDLPQTLFLRGSPGRIGP